jgi:Tol biopolymer transport system component/DNA-binding winged helix-turn-helix (wHTH) protein
MANPDSHSLFRFGEFELDITAYELRRGGQPVHLERQPMDLLILLVERRHQLVGRADIVKRLWDPGVFVDVEMGVNTAIRKLRQALGDSRESPAFVETISGKGYRFIAQVDSPARLPSSAVEPRPPHAGSRSWRPWIAAMALLLTVGIAALFVYVKHEEPGSARPRALKRLTFDAGLQFGPTWSPDGRFIAYSSDRGGKFDIWVQQVGAVTPVKITTRRGDNWQPDWSPDGNQIVFRSEGEGGGLIVIPALGGPERKISSFGYHPKWSPDGRRILFGNTFISWFNKLYVVGLDGGPPREILAEFLRKSQIAERAAQWYPDSNRVSLWGEKAHGLGFWTVSLDGTGAVESGATPSVAEQLGKLTGHERAQFRWGPSGRAIYFEGEWNGVQNIWKITVNPSSIRFVALDRLTAGPGPDTDLAMSPDGKKLAYTARNERVRVWSYPFDARSGRLLGDGSAVTPAGFDAWRADISPDGKKLAYVVHRAGEHELWQTSLPDGPTSLLLRAPDDPSNPRWSPDSQRVGFSESRGGIRGRLVLLRDGGGSADPLTSTSFEGDVEDWSADGQWVVAEQVTHDQPRLAQAGRSWTGAVELRIVLLPLSAAPNAESRARLVTSSRSQGIYEGIYEIRLSPNGRWIVFEAVKGGEAPGGATNATLCVVRVSGGPWTRVTDGQFWDDKPRWSPDGKTIFFVSSRTGFLNVWGIRFDPEQGRPQGQPFQVTSFGNPKLMVADDMSWQSMSLSQGRLVLSMSEASGSVWALHDVDK